MADNWSLPARERGLKPKHDREYGATQKSLPARERGLKLIFRPPFAVSEHVAPRAGAWIETASGPSTLASPARSLPARERGLKPITLTFKDLRNFRSLPARERGLKLLYPAPSHHLAFVAPRAGAWIET